MRAHQERSPYQYYLLPAVNPPKAYIRQHNEIFCFWKSVWRDVLRDLGVEAGNLADEFGRQDLIAAICADSGVLAVHLYSFFRLDSLVAREHRYLKGNYPNEFFQKLRERNIETVMSLEYMTVNPEWRKRKADVHIGAVLAALGLSLLRHYHVDAAIAPARRDHKVHEMAHLFGGDSVIENVKNHNVACDLIAVHRERIKTYPVSEVDRLRQELWEQRIHCDTFGSTIPIPHNLAA